MARVIPNQASWIGFANSVSNLALPTLAEINNAIDLTGFTVSINASMRGNVVATPDFSNKFETSIDGTVTGTFEADFYRDTSSTAINNPSGLAAAAVGSGGTFAAATYFWKITALQGERESAGSNEATVAIVANGSANLTWTAVAGATGYRIYRSTTTGTENGATNFVAQVGNVLAYTDTGAAPTSAFVMPSANQTNGDIAWNILPRGTGGFFLVSRFGGGGTNNRPNVAGNKLEVWPVRITSRSMANLTNNTAQTFTVTGAINTVPVESATAT